MRSFIVKLYQQTNLIERQDFIFSCTDSNSFTAEFNQMSIKLVISVNILETFTFGNFVKRRICDIQITGFDQRTHLTVEECEQQCTDVRSIDVSICHDYHAVITGF